MPAQTGSEMSKATPSASMVYIVLLNWNGWRDTIECLESVFRLECQDFAVVVCDNASSDRSMEHISAWARGEETAHPTPFLKRPPVPKPIHLRRFTRYEAEGGYAESAPLVLVDTGANLGFAGGCNVGIRYALTQRDCGFVWLLNNDTVVPPDALAAMIKLCRARPSVGLCGSQVRYYGAPAVVQTFGGLLSPWFCTTHSIACGSAAVAVTEEPPRIDYVPGASMLATRAFLEAVGLMSESYFLYFEEIDWAERAKSSFDLAVAPSSVVYHRGAASIGSPSEQGERGIRSEYFLLRGRAVFAHKFYRARLPIVYLGLIGSLINRLRRGQWRRAGVAMCVLTGLRPAMLKLPAISMGQDRRT
jgi:GT2 family glycosyltransferase